MRDGISLVIRSKNPLPGGFEISSRYYFRSPTKDPDTIIANPRTISGGRIGKLPTLDNYDGRKEEN